MFLLLLFELLKKDTLKKFEKINNLSDVNMMYIQLKYIIIFY